MKNHEYFEELVNLKVDGMLAAEQEAELDAHLKTCPDCRNRLDIYMTVKRLSDDLLVDPPEDFTRDVMSRLGLEKSRKSPGRRLLPRIFTIAGAAAAIAILIFSGTFKSFLRSGDKSYSLSAADTARESRAALPEQAGSGSLDDGAITPGHDEVPAGKPPVPNPDDESAKMTEADKTLQPPQAFGAAGFDAGTGNVFDPANSRVGDVLMGFEIVEIETETPGGENIRIVFDGEATLTGTLYFDNNENARWGKFIRFHADSGSAAILPYPSDGFGDVWFGIDNYDQAVKMLDAGPEDEGKTIVYNAVIVIDGYTVTQNSSDIPAFATLKSIESHNRISD
jgi:hypothetical protein